MMRQQGISPDFVSWHYYGNYPFVGPDGPEPGFPPQAYPALAHNNPLGGVAEFPIGIEVMRKTVSTALAGTGWTPALIIDEWNISAGGFDHRNDTYEAAAFDAGVLTEFQRESLDRSALFISKDAYFGSTFPCKTNAGDWGIVSCAGIRKPAWWTFWLWNRLAPSIVATTGSSTLDGLWATAARDDDRRVTVMLASYLQSGARSHKVMISFTGLTGPMSVEVWRLDRSYANAASPAQTLSLAGSRLQLDLPANSVAFLELRPAP
jgi:hypothetical protein